jgi:hypothetical protein
MSPYRGISIFAAAFLLLQLAMPCPSAVPRVINYQARLTDSGGAPVKTAVTLTFTFWDSESGGAQLGGGYSDSKLVQPDANGVVSTQVGEDPGNPIPASVFAGTAVWLRAMLGAQEIVPRMRISTVGYAFRAADADAVGGVPGAAIAAIVDAFPRRGGAHLVVETTASATLNGTNLLAAYAAAKALSPNGRARGTDNRATVLVPPGAYDLGAGQLVLDAEFVDLVGMSTARDDQHVSSTSSGANTGVLRQTANDVHIENLVVECTRTSVTAAVAKYAPAAYFPDDATTQTVARNCEFRSDDVHAWAMRLGTAYPGTFTDCEAGQGSFGFGAAASGTFTRCTAGDYSFGAFYGDASGTFTDCVGGEYAFGGDHALASGRLSGCHGGDCSFGGYRGNASGTFEACVGGEYAFGGKQGEASGSFNHCIGDDYAFGGDTDTTASGEFKDCTGGLYAFGGKGTASGQFTGCTGLFGCFGGYGGTANGDFIDCTGMGSCFGGDGGKASGTFRNCRGGTYAFGGYMGRANGFFTNCTGGSWAFAGDWGDATGTFVNCSGGDFAFGGNCGFATGSFLSCTGGDHAFGGWGGYASGRFTDCLASGWSFGTSTDGWGNTGSSDGAKLVNCKVIDAETPEVPFEGRMENCRWEGSFVCAAKARIYGSTFAGTLDLGNTAAGATQSRAKSIVNAGSNAFGATNATAMNIADPDVQ